MDGVEIGGSLFKATAAGQDYFTHEFVPRQVVFHALTNPSVERGNRVRTQQISIHQ